jgi:hypothetical protein
MPKNIIKKRKHGIIYYPAPRKRSASYFLAAFFLTLAAIGLIVGIAIADRNSRRLGWDEPSEVFAVSSAGKQIDVTMMGKNFTIETYSTTGFFVKLRQVAITFEPQPMQFIEIAWARLESEADRLMSYSEELLPQGYR